MKYEPNPYDLSTNAGIIIPPVVYMELKCKRPDPKAIVRGREELVLHRPLVAYKVDYEPTRYVFTPLAQPEPPWQVVRGFIVGSYVLEAYAPVRSTHQPEGLQSLLMWDLAGQEHWRSGETIGATTVTMARVAP